VECDDIVKKLLLKLRTLLVVSLIIAGGWTAIWLIGTISEFAGKNDEGIGGTIIFGVFGIGFIAIIIYFLVRKPKTSYYDKKTPNLGLLKEDMYNDIKRKHS
jgi:hypothetical protein